MQRGLYIVWLDERSFFIIALQENEGYISYCLAIHFAEVFPFDYIFLTAFYIIWIEAVINHDHCFWS